MDGIPNFQHWSHSTGEVYDRCDRRRYTYKQDGRGAYNSIEDMALNNYQCQVSVDNLRGLAVSLMLISSLYLLQKWMPWLKSLMVECECYEFMCATPYNDRCRSHERIIKNCQVGNLLPLP